MRPVNDNSVRHARYNCSVCSRPFDRKDVLARHMLVHDKSRQRARTKRKACLSCSQSKIRCDGGRPKCTACLKRNTSCVFPDSGIPHCKTSQGLHSKGSSKRLSRDTTRSSPVLPDLEDEPCSVGTSPLAQGLLMDDTSDQEYNGNVSGAQHLLPEPVPDLHNLDNSTTNPIFIDYANLDFNSNLNWFLETASPDELLWEPHVFDIRGLTETGLFQPHSQAISHDSSSNTYVNDNEYQTASKYAAHLSEEPLGGLLVPQPQATRSYGDPWPLEAPRPPQRHTILPGLGLENQHHIPTDRYYHIQPITNEVWNSLQRCICLPFDHNALQTLSIECFPSKEALDHCIDLYFAHFHPTLAIIHLPTFNPGEDLVVTLVVVCIGACYTAFDGAQAFSTALSILIRRLLVFMSEHDHRFVRTRSHLTTQLLQGVRKFTPKQSPPLTAH